MKKLMKSLMLFAAAAMALTSCENEAMNEGIEANETYTLNFVTGAPDSRTAVDVNTETGSATFSWNESGEYLRFLQYPEDKSAIYQQKSDEGVVTDNKATFSVTFSNQVAGVSTYYYSAIYPETGLVDKGSVSAVKVKIPTQQTLTANSFDPAADLMIAKPVLAEYNSTDIHSLQFTRLASIGRMNIKGITEGENILKVVFTLDEGTAFVGSGATVNAETSVLVDKGDTNAVTLVANSSFVATEAGTPVYFTCFPLEYTGSYTLEIETDAANYVKSGSIATGKTLSFTEGVVRGFNVSAGDRTPKEQTNAAWVKVNSLDELTAGTKVVLVGTVGTTNYGLKENDTSSAPSAVEVTIEENTIAEVSVNTITTFTIEVDDTNIILNNDDSSAWLYCTSSNNGVRFGTNTNKTWTVDTHTNNFQFKHVGTNRYLGIYNKQDWRCYTSLATDNFTNGSGTSDIAIYRYSEDGSSTPVLANRDLQFSVTAVSVVLGETFDEPVLSGETTGVVYSSSNTDVATVNAETGVVTIKAVGTTTITAAAEANETLKADETSYELTVLSAELAGTGEGSEASPYDVTRAIDAIDRADSNTVSEVYVKGVVTEDAITYNSTYSSLTYYITDGTNKMQVYSGKGLNNADFASANDLHAGDEVIVYGTIKLYNSTYEFDYNNYIVSLDCGHAANSTEQTVSFTSQPESVTVDSTVTVVATANTTITYSSDNTNVATVDATTGVVTGVAEGTATITATAAAEGIYKTASASYNITVNAKPEGGESQTYTENFTTWSNNTNTNNTSGTTVGDICSWSWVGASKLYWSNVSSGSTLSFAITLLKPAAADGTYVLSETLNGGIKSLTLTARSNNASTGVNIYVIDVATDTTHKVGTLNTIAKKTDATQTYDLTSLNITGQYQIKIANKSTAAYCCIGGLTWSN